MSNNRVDNFHGNVAAWKCLADVQIDYFTQFVKAWIPFNAWFSTSYPSGNTDRDILNLVKNGNNSFKNKIINYLTRSDSESKIFLTQIGKLHFELEETVIPSFERKISFTNVVIEKNTLPSFDNFVVGKGFKFKVRVTYDHSALPGSQKINIQVIDIIGPPANQGRMNWNQNEWNVKELKDNGQYKLLNIAKENHRIKVQQEILNCYNQINPLRPTNLLLEPLRKNRLSNQLVAPLNSITIDETRNYYFIDDADKIVKAIIEILYNLRNALFHGEINPSSDVQNIYREAYYLLYPLIKILN